MYQQEDLDALGHGAPETLHKRLLNVRKIRPAVITEFRAASGPSGGTRRNYWWSIFARDRAWSWTPWDRS
ncbi:MAG: hypothetical protein MPN21_27775, partial [Thermoanaerobaculia bacterium]|nr:hypothetical protein [Thermoanaerobaculia bacterium]